MRFNNKSGCIDVATWLPSPNADDRILPGYVNCLVIHAISLPPEQFGGHFVEDFFCNRLDECAYPYFKTISELRVSAHFYIPRTGALVQFVSTHCRAWHAGVSSFRALDKVNDFSIGIELEGCDTEGFTDKQYRTLTELSRCLMNVYPAITKNRIVGHSEIAPGRKTDPGPLFDWDRYNSSLQKSDSA